MPGFQPRMTTDHVWWNGEDIHTYDVATGVGVRVTEVRGWDERPDIRDVREQRSGQDGEYADNLYLGGRTISIAGVVHGSSWVNLQARKRTLAALFNPSSTEYLFKIPDPATASPTAVYASTGMTGYERVSARVIEPIMFGDMVGSAAMTFQVVLRASDPRVYSDTATSTDSGTSGTASRTVTVDQGGTYETPPTLTVTGPTGSDFTVAEPSSGLSLPFSGLTLTSANTVRVDTQERTAYVTGAYALERVQNATTPAAAIWMLGETSGTTADNAEGTAARDATYTGGFTLNQSGPFTGYPSVLLNGSTGYVSIPNQTALYSQYTVFETWVYFTTLSGTQTIIDGITSNRGFRLQWNGSAFVTTIGNATTTASNTVLPTDAAMATATWYRVLMWVAPRSAGSGISNVYVRVETSDGATVHDNLNTSHSLEMAAQTSGGYRLGSLLAGGSYLSGRLCAAALYPSSIISSALYNSVAQMSTDMTGESSAYQYLTAEASRWAYLGTGSSIYTLSSSGLNTGSKLNVSYRDARL